MAFKKEHGDLYIPSIYRDANNFMLGQTASGYRSAKRRGELSSEKVDFLDSIGFPWELETPTGKKFAWKNFIEELDLYKATHGDLDISNTYIAPSGFGLGKKVRKTRTLKNKGQLEPDKVELLTSMGFSWSRKR